MGALWQGEGRLGLAVSGGADSLALLLLARAARPGGVEAATVDHQLRPESAAEARFVAGLCGQFGVPHATLPVTLSAGCLQAAARQARYAALAQWGAERQLSAIVTAHHADDQAETLLMRLNRSSGVAGLAGIRPSGSVPGGAMPLIRPLLGWRRHELAGIVESAWLVAVDDPSNRDGRFDRARIRAALADSNWLDVPALAASASYLAEADEALGWIALKVQHDMVVWTDRGAIYRPGAPRVIALRVMAAIIRQLGGGAVRGSALARAHDALLRGRPVTLAGLCMRPSSEGWHFQRETGRRVGGSEPQNA